MLKKPSSLLISYVILCQPVIINVGLYGLSLGRRGRVNNSIAIKTSCGINMWFTNSRKSIQVCFKRGTLKWKEGRILAESCIEQGFAVRRSCICHFFMQKRKWRWGNRKQKDKRAARRAQLFRILKPKTYWQKVSGRLQTWLKAMWTALIQREEWRNVMASWLDWWGQNQE